MFKVLLFVVLAAIFFGFAGVAVNKDGNSWWFDVAPLMGMGACFVALSFVSLGKWYSERNTKKIILSKLDPEKGYQIVGKMLVEKGYHVVFSEFADCSKTLLYLYDLEAKEMRVAVLVDSPYPPVGFKEDGTPGARLFLVPVHKKMVHGENKDFVFVPNN